MRLLHLLNQFPQEKTLPATRPYFNHSVEFKKSYSPIERMEMLEKVGYNVFFYPAEMVTGCDLLSDSGTTTMTNEQWASLHLGDEAYGSNKGYFLLLKTIDKVFGSGFTSSQHTKIPLSFLFHQGRPAEDALFSAIGKLGKKSLIPSNGHFDTTAANIEANKITPLNLFSKELKDANSNFSFKGNIDILKLEKLLQTHRNKVPLIFLSITNNTGGGQPVSLANIKKVSALSKKYQIPFFFDACRFAENAYFIKTKEKGYQNMTTAQIVKEMFSYVDGFTISFKKDGLVNMGGGLFLKEKGLFVKKYPHLSDELMNHQITKEGHPTYGGMSGRDIMALIYGLKTILEDQYLHFRIRQVHDFGMQMKKLKLPVVTPIGGHAVYLDMDRFFAGTKMKFSDFGGIAFTALLLGLYGHRACELGHFAFGKDVNFVRFAIPRLRYEKEDLESVVTAVKSLYDRRQQIPKVKVIYGRDLPLRHFKARFELE